jgi:hypothetical protein
MVDKPQPEWGGKGGSGDVIGEEKRTRPSPGAFFTNLAGPESWSRKLRLLLRNN